MIVGDISELEASHIYQTYSRKSLSFSKRFAEPAVILPSQWGEINLIEQKHKKKKINWKIILIEPKIRLCGLNCLLLNKGHDRSWTLIVDRPACKLLLLA